LVTINYLNKIVVFFALLLAVGASSIAQTAYPTPVEGDFTIRNYKFRSGETLPELRLHYRTIGKSGNPAVLIMHGTGGSGAQFVRDVFADQLFHPGQLLDAGKYFIVLPDDVGHGKSSKPSDGLHAKFPHYDYDDMIDLEYRLLTEHLGVKHLRLVMGTSMGGMHTWLWGEAYPDFMDALMPLASLPVEIAGRNRMTRKMAMDAIRGDPEWNNGDYTKQPRGLLTAIDVLIWMGSSPLQYQKQYPTREAADKYLDEQMVSRMRGNDANDLLYQFDSSRNYNPQPKLGLIKAPLLAINSADDQVNPPELGILEREIKHVAKGRALVLPITDDTRGHGTHTIAKIWSKYLAELLEQSKH
jgi:homoserine O-acetyltransferase/O-succinyltransferase